MHAFDWGRGGYLNLRGGEYCSYTVHYHYKYSLMSASFQSFGRSASVQQIPVGHVRSVPHRDRWCYIDHGTKVCLLVGCPPALSTLVLVKLALDLGFAALVAGPSA
jgi:hypothetical protein